MQSGFSMGALHKQRSLPTFAISKHPVTWAEYDACAGAGHCKAIKSSPCGGYSQYATYSRVLGDMKAEQAAAVCVSENDAEAYCRSIGARLPTLDEWLLAARGPSPRRYSWGRAPSTCDQHPFAPELIAHHTSGGQAVSELCPGTATAAPGATASMDPGAVPPIDPAAFAVGTHASGASPFGVEDVLLTPGELLSADPEGQYNVCSKQGSHCVVYGLEPAAIDAVEPFYELKKSAGQPRSSVVGHSYSFRCVANAS
jgi:hypothetical protein